MEQEKIHGILQVAGAIAIVALVLYFGNAIAALSSLGYLGVFIISLLSSATILIPAPGWVAVVALGKTLNPFYVGIFAGIGSALGELTGYYAGAGAKKLMAGGKFDKVKDFIGKNDIFAIFVLAFIPNPAFDIAGLASGSVGIPMPRFLVPCILGRVLRYAILAYTGAFVQDFLYLLF